MCFCSMCAFSLTIARILTKKYRTALVVSDDVIFHSSMKTRMLEFHRRLPGLDLRWDMMKLGPGGDTPFNSSAYAFTLDGAKAVHKAGLSLKYSSSGHIFDRVFGQCASKCTISEKGPEAVYFDARVGREIHKPAVPVSQVIRGSQ
jgi:hypothetical protein